MTTRSDDELEQYLGRRSQLSREYQALGGDEPPAAVDARVLAEARKAVASQTGWRRRPTLRWLAPVALAATVVLSFSLLFRVGEVPVPARDTAVGSAPAPPVPPAGPARLAKEEPPALAVAPPPAAPPVAAFTAESGAPAIVAAERARQESLQDTDLAAVRRALPAEAAPGAPPDLAPVMAAIRARLGAATDATKAAEVPVAAEEQAAVDDPDARLREILRRYESGDIAGAVSALAEFRRAHPDDPVAVQFVPGR